MAKRKGKSRHRIQDWKQLLSGQPEMESHAPGRQKFAPKAVKLPAWRQQVMESDLQALPRCEGMVVGLFPGGSIVRGAEGILLCGVAGTFRAAPGSSALAVGDVVSVALTRPRHADQARSDSDRADGMILSRQDRRTALCRPMPRSGKRRDAHADEDFDKVIAANMDVLLVVASTRAPALHLGVIDRFLIIAQRGQLEPVVVINKIDLQPPEELLLEDLRRRGVAVVPCSTVSGQGLDELRHKLAGRQSVLAGASGVGKSTLVNALAPHAQAATAAVRTRDERGRHTTSSAAVYDLPGGGIVVDTPGVRELGVGLTAGELPWYFPEFEAPAGQCRFNDCTHVHEPRCAVIDAVRRGDIPAARYEAYLRILQTLGG